MNKDFTVLVGTIGSGAWLSPDGGENWRRVVKGLWSESRVYGLAVHPVEKHTIFAGANDGVYKSTDGGQSFEHIDSPMNAMDVWKIAFDPSDPNIVFAGTRPAALFRSTDGGLHWRQCRVDMAEDCPNVRIPRVTALTVDPADPRMVWAGVEVDGVRRSTDGGETWSRITDGIDDPDIHDVTTAVTAGKAVFTTTPREIFASDDRGGSWHGLGVGRHFALPYCRSLAVKPGDPDTLFVATGDGAVGKTGAIQRSLDGGEHWKMLKLPVEPNSPIWAFATNPADPDRVVACSHYGELYRSDDCGDGWTKLPREFTEIRAVAWVPN
jgi:photosystem II stability/assembly factor-like uncharacterized protein